MKDRLKGKRRQREKGKGQKSEKGVNGKQSKKPVRVSSRQAFCLFLSQVDLDWAAAEVEVLSESVLQVSRVWVPYVLRTVTEECK